MPPLTVGHWLAGHVEAAVVQAALELGLLGRLASGAWSPADLAQAADIQPRGLTVVLEALTGLGVVEHAADGYRLAAGRCLPEPASVAPTDWAPLRAARHAWATLGAGLGPDDALLLESAEAAIRDATPETVWLVESIWRHVWSAALITLAVEGVLAELQPGPSSVAGLSAASGLAPTTLRPLLRAGQHTGVVALDGESVELTPAARPALGEGSVAEFGRWMAQRLQMERTYFWHPLAQLTDSLRSGQSVTRTSAPAASASFRATFTRVNQPLLPVLLRVAGRVARDLGASGQPWRVLELGTSLGHWGAALAAAHPCSTVVAVDAPDVLSETQRLVSAARLSERYRWHPVADLSCLADLGETEPFDVVVLHEICHTLAPERLATWLATVAARLAPGGHLLIADMLLDPSRAAPQRHLLSAVKLLVTGGGTLLDTRTAASLLPAQNFSAVRCYRLPTTDLLVARRAGPLPPKLGGWPGLA